MKEFGKSFWVLVSLFLMSIANLNAEVVGTCEWSYEARVLVIKACPGIESGVLEPAKVPTDTVDIVKCYPYLKYRNQISRIIIYPGVTKIGAYAFSNLPLLQEVSFLGTSTLTSIGAYAFAYTPFFESIMLDESNDRVYGLPAPVREIGDFAFAESALNSFEVPDSCVWLGRGIFIGSYVKDIASFSKNFKVSEDGNLLLDETGSEIIAAVTGLTSLQIPDGVRTIRSGAFYNNVKLTSISGGKDLVSIESMAFEGATSLKSICLSGEKEVVIGENAFDVSINANCVATASNEKTVANLSGQISQAYSRVCGENMNWSLSDDKTILYITGSGRMYDFEKSAPWYPLNKFVTAVNFSGKCLSIGKSAFYGMSRLSKISGDLAEIAEVGDSAFMNVAALTNLVLDSFPALSVIGGSSFSNLKSQQITIPHTVASIGDNALNGTSLLKIYDNSVADISPEQFSETQKKSCVVYVTTSAQKEKYVKTGLPSSNVFVVNCDNDEGLLNWKFDAEKGKLTISGTGEIYDYGEGKYPWESIKLKIREVEIPLASTVIPAHAFSGCVSLSSIHHEGMPDISNVNVIGSNAFENADFHEFTLSSALKTIGKNPFAGNLNLKKINVATLAFNDGDKIVGLSKDNVQIHVVSEDSNVANEIYQFFKVTSNFEYVFYKNCGNTLSWEIVSGMLIIRNTSNNRLPCAMWNFSSADQLPWAAYRTSITSVRLPDKLTNISPYAFQGCPNLKSINIPLTVDEIGAYAFDSTAITQIHIPASVSSIDAWGVNSIKKISVDPANSRYTSRNAEGEEVNMLLDKSNVELHVCPPSTTTISFPKTLTSVGKFAFNGAVGKLFIPASVKTMNSWPLWAAELYVSNEPTAYAIVPDSLKKVKVYATTQSVMDAYKTMGFSNVSLLASCGDNASYLLDRGLLTIFGSGTVSSHPWSVNAASIRRVVVEKGITSLCPEAFKGCSSLSSLSLPDGLESIGASLIEGCSALKSLYLPNTVSEIAPAAFVGNSLTSIKAQKGGAYLSEDANGSSCNALYADGGATLVFAIDSRITNLVTTVGAYSLAGANIANLNIPSSVDFIGASSFADASISNIYSSSIAPIPADAFSPTVKAKANVYVSSESVKRVFVSAGFAESKITVADGKCGDNLFYTIKRNKLTIFGGGEMDDYDTVAAPWQYTASTITSIVFVGDAITKIGAHAFEDSPLKGELAIPSSVSIIGENAFSSSAAITVVKSLSQTPPVLFNGTFPDEVYEKASLVVPVNAKNTYATSLNWEKFSGVQTDEDVVSPYDLNNDGYVNVSDVTVLKKVVK